MRSRLILLALLMLAGLTPAANAQGRVYRTKGGYVGCLSLSDFNEQTKLLVSGDRQAWAQFIQDSSCVPMKAGVEVYMENAKGLGVIKIRPKGTTVWFYTYTEAIS